MYWTKAASCLGLMDAKSKLTLYILVQKSYEPYSALMLLIFQMPPFILQNVCHTCSHEYESG